MSAIDGLIDKFFPKLNITLTNLLLDNTVPCDQEIKKTC